MGRSNAESSVIPLLVRPRPPVDLVSIDGGLAGPDRFDPAPDVVTWIRAAYLDEAGPLYAPEMEHLRDAHIGVLWTNAPNLRRGRRIVGQAEMPMAGNPGGGRWGRQRWMQQLRGWFGTEPDFLITLDALHADEVDDATFCALVDHELRHCGQQLDEYGMPKFDRDGRPVFGLVGHDVEEFVGTVRRFGVRAAGDQAVDFVVAAARPPEIAPARLAQACGTCIAARRSG